MREEERWKRHRREHLDTIFERVVDAGAATDATGWLRDDVCALRELHAVALAAALLPTLTALTGTGQE